MSSRVWHVFVPAVRLTVRVLRVYYVFVSSPEKDESALEGTWNR